MVYAAKERAQVKLNTLGYKIIKRKRANKTNEDLRDIWHYYLMAVCKTKLDLAKDTTKLPPIDTTDIDATCFYRDLQCQKTETKKLNLKNKKSRMY